MSQIARSLSISWLAKIYAYILFADVKANIRIELEDMKRILPSETRKKLGN